MHTRGQESWGHLAILPTTGASVNFLVLVTVLWLCKVFTIGETEKLWSTFAIILYLKRKNLKTWHKNHSLRNNTTICESVTFCSLAYVILLNLPKGKELCQGYTTSLEPHPKSNHWDKNYRASRHTLLYLQIKVNRPEFKITLTKWLRKSLL